MSGKLSILLLSSTLLFLLASIAGCQKDPSSEPDAPDSPDVVVPSDSVPSTEKDTVAERQYPDYAKAGRLEINTKGGAAITSKEDYVECTVAIKHDNVEWCDSAMTGGIRGRGNSTWEWYPKKPYRIKFDSKEEMLGLPKAKSWVLLAEYRDPTSLMNAFVFELGQLMGLPATNHNRWVELTLNGKNLGLYHLTEQVQQGKNRVNINETTGYLISLDRDDGPELAGYLDDNFWSEIYRMPVCIKSPDDVLTVKNDLKADLGLLEKAIRDVDYEEICKRLDINTMIDYLIVQEFVYNVELDAPRSMYMHKDIDSKWKMGPLWDFDAGFDFDWSDMYSGHGYFESYKELVLGTNPATHEGTIYRVPGFFSDLFKNPEFVSAYKNRFKAMTPIVEEAWKNTMVYYEANRPLWEADLALWPIRQKYDVEIENMRKWISNRIVYLSNVVAKY